MRVYNIFIVELQSRILFYYYIIENTTFIVWRSNGGGIVIIAVIIFSRRRRRLCDWWMDFFPHNTFVCLRMAGDIARRAAADGRR